MSATLSIQYGHTGRTEKLGEEHRNAKEWSEQPDQNTLKSHKMADRFRCLIDKVTNVSLNTPWLLLRGRRSGAPITNAREMGPPPDSVSGDGRYNRVHQSVLYLCETVDGIQRELAEGSDPLYVQRFLIPIDRIKIADFSVPLLIRESAPNIDSEFVTSVFSIAEECNVANRGPNNYNFSQIVAEIVANQFQGMRIPGVRGHKDHQYNNVVIFSPGEWEEWLDPDASPYCPDS